MSGIQVNTEQPIEEKPAINLEVRKYKCSSQRRYHSDPEYRQIVLNRVKAKYDAVREENKKKKEIRKKLYSLEEQIVNLKKQKKDEITKAMNEIEERYRDKLVDLEDEMEQVKTNILNLTIKEK